MLISFGIIRDLSKVLTICAVFDILQCAAMLAGAVVAVQMAREWWRGRA